MVRPELVAIRSHSPSAHTTFSMARTRAFLALTALCHIVLAAVPLERRQDSSGYGFENGQPQSNSGKGAPLLGGTDKQIDLANPANLGEESTDNGVVPNLKWRFSDSKTRLLPGGWVREQVITDLPVSTDIAAAQQHLQRGTIREIHWHKVAEWGWVYAGRVTVSAVDEQGRYQVSELQPGDVWYFPTGVAHTIQGLDDENEYLLAFDEADFDKVGTTFMVDDWLIHTPLDVIAKNFGVNETVFEDLPKMDPYILNATVADEEVTAPNNEVLSGNSSYVYIARDNAVEPVPGGGGTFRKVDASTFPISETISAAFVTLEPGGLRELHWHPNVSPRTCPMATVSSTDHVPPRRKNGSTFTAATAAPPSSSATPPRGPSTSLLEILLRASPTLTPTPHSLMSCSYAFSRFPDNSGHYIENTSEDETLEWVEIYKSDRVADISLAQWLALTPPNIVVSAAFILMGKWDKWW